MLTPKPGTIRTPTSKMGLDAPLTHMSAIRLRKVIAPPHPDANVRFSQVEELGEELVSHQAGGRRVYEPPIWDVIQAMTVPRPDKVDRRGGPVGGVIVRLHSR